MGVRAGGWGGGESNCGNHLLKHSRRYWILKDRSFLENSQIYLLKDLWCWESGYVKHEKTTVVVEIQLLNTFIS